VIDLAIITPPETFPYEHPTLFTDRDPELELKTPVIILPELFTCQRCREDLPFEAFPLNAYHKGAGRDYWCKPCKAAYKREVNAKRRAAEGLKPRTRRPSEPKPEQPKPVKVRIIPAPKAPAPATIAIAEAPPISLFRQKLRERKAAAS
jgi:hypothetical protein